MKREVLCVIPARGGSKGIPRKNIKLLSGQPLIYYVLSAALNAASVSRVVVSTDDVEIAQIAKGYGAEVPFLRPLELAGDDVHSVYPVIDVINKLKKTEGYVADVVIMLLPTAPLTTSAHIDEALKVCFIHGSGSVISVSPFDKPLSAIRKIEDGKMKPILEVKNFNVQRQEYHLFMVNASIYISHPEELIRNKTFHCEEVYPYIMTKKDSLDINDENDFEIAEYILSNKR